MKQEEKDLLLKDLCARLPYGVKFGIGSAKLGRYDLTDIDVKKEKVRYGNGLYADLERCKPYLRPLSSMTEEERKIICSMNLLSDIELSDRLNYPKMYVQNYTIETFDLFNAHNLDYRGLIPMGLALEDLEGMYK